MNNNNDNNNNKIKNKNKQSRTIDLMMMNDKRKRRLNSKRKNRKRNADNNKEALVKDKARGLKPLHRSAHSNAIVLWGKQNKNNQAGFRLKIYILFLKIYTFRFKIYIV